MPRTDWARKMVEKVQVREVRDGMGPAVLSATAMHLLRLRDRAWRRAITRLYIKTELGMPPFTETSKAYNLALADLARVMRGKA